MIEIILVTLSIMLVIGYFFVVVRPKATMNWYKTEFEKQNYKVKVIKYKAFGYTSMQAFQEGVSKHQNCMKYFIDDCQGYDVVICNIMQRVQIILLSPQLIQQFCKNQRQWCYQKDKKVISFVGRVTGVGLISSQGQFWKNKRKTMNMFFSHDFVSNMTTKIKNICRKTLNIDKTNQTVIHNNSNNNNSVQLSVMKLCTDITSSIILSGFLGGQLQSQRLQGEHPINYLMALIYRACDQFVDPVSLLLGPKFLDMGLRAKDQQFNRKMNIFNSWAIHYIKTRVDEQRIIIQHKQQKYIPSDIISAQAFSYLKKTDDHQSSSHYRYTQQDLLSQLKTFFIAGTDTTSHVLQLMIYYIFKNPDIQQKVREQINNLNLPEQFVESDIKNMKYLQAVQKQSIRLGGPLNVIITRVALKDHLFKGARIRKGCVIRYTSITTHYNAKNYKEPKQFRPERWINGQCDNLHLFGFCGFHGGPRSCIGKQLSSLQSKIAIIVLIQNYKKIQVLCQKLKYQSSLVIQANDFKIKLFQ